MNFFSTIITKKSIELANKVLSSGYVSAGDYADKFENELSNILGLLNPVSVNSGTSALHLGLEVAGIGEGDEVILPAQTFVASGLAILMTGAKPVFSDIQYQTGNIDPNSIKDMITEKTKAIMPVHWGGYPCELDEISKIAKDNNLIILEDAAHALGSTYKGKPIGTLSHYTAFSFQAIKHLTGGDGGALCCKNQVDYEMAQKLRWFGIDRKNSKPSILGERVFDIDKIGFKYHMNDLAAAVALGNLEGFTTRLKKIRMIASTYEKELLGVKGVTLLDYEKDLKSSYWLFTLLVEDRLNFIKMMKNNNIPVSVVHQRIDRFSVFGGIVPGLVNQEKFDENQVSIPIHSELNEEDINTITQSINRGW